MKIFLKNRKGGRIWDKNLPFKEPDKGNVKRIPEYKVNTVYIYLGVFCFGLLIN